MSIHSLKQLLWESDGMRDKTRDCSSQLYCSTKSQQRTNNHTDWTRTDQVCVFLAQIHSKSLNITSEAKSFILQYNDSLQIFNNDTPLWTKTNLCWWKYKNISIKQTTFWLGVYNNHNSNLSETETQACGKCAKQTKVYSCTSIIWHKSKSCFACLTLKGSPKNVNSVINYSHVVPNP